MAGRRKSNAHRVKYLVAVVSISIVAVSISTIRNTSSILSVFQSASQLQIEEYHQQQKRQQTDDGFPPTTTTTTTTTGHAVVPPKASSFLISKNSTDFIPTLRIPIGECIPSPNQPLRKVTSFPYYEDPTKFWNNNNLPLLLAVCKLNMMGNTTSTSSTHFPHMMQQLYGCYTYWKENPSRIPVLYTISRLSKESTMLKLEENAFLKGFLQVMTSQLKVIIMTRQDIKDWLKSNKSTTTEDNDVLSLPTGAQKKQDTTTINTTAHDDDDTNINTFTAQGIRISGGYILSHVQDLNAMVEKHYFNIDDVWEEKTKQSSNDISSNNSTSSLCLSSPRIGILNRKPSVGRSILNAEYLIRKISDENVNVNNRNSNDSKNSSTKPPPPPPSSSPPPTSLISLEYFERKNFEGQVRFLNNVDILISPHGAQLTGIPFLANKPCAQLIEIFPSRYLIPDFFGSLAQNSGIAYSYIYASDNDAITKEEHQHAASSSIHGRITARAQNICLSPTAVVDIVKDVILDWRKCCDQTESAN
jgi:hypothetical protein